MHAYLIVGRDEEKIEAEVDKLAKMLKAKILEFALAKIADVRELNSFTKLTIDKRTAILIKGIDHATTPALNAFLKNLEEPQENLFYILTCANKHILLPTIISRCQIIKTTPGAAETGHEAKAKKFLQMDGPSQLLFISKIKARSEAIDFTEELILGLHLLLIKTGQNHLKISKSIRAANIALNNLQANGNVGLQLTNFVFSLV